MAALKRFPSPYDVRVALVKDTITAHTQLGDDDAHALAVDVLQALQSVPEKIR